MKAIENSSLFTELNDETAANLHGGQLFPGYNAPLINDPAIAAILANDPLLATWASYPTNYTVLTYDPSSPYNFTTQFLANMGYF